MTPDAATPPTDPAAGTPPGGKPAGLVISDEIRKKYPDLIDLIIGSESMNDEERQYWINILPIMTPEQIQNLREILTNEKRQLQAIDEKYSKEIEQIGQTQLVQRMEDERRRKRTERSSVETTHAKKEQEDADALLKEIEGK